MTPALLDLIDALAAAEVASYMHPQAAPANDSAYSRSEPPASEDERQAA
ncbi:MAG TPA: hypothetical protein VGE09_16760 [Pseudoxanthomonas sp.]